MREARWHLRIDDEVGTPLLCGLKLVTNWRLLMHYHADPRVPPGDLWVSDHTEDGSPPGLDDLGLNLRCTLTYGES